MILLIYLLIGAFILALTFIPLIWRSRFANVSARTNLMNGLAIALSAIYLILTIYVIVREPLPIYNFKRYLFADSLAMYEVLITCIIFLLASIYGRGYIKSLIAKDSVRGNSVGLFYTFFCLLLIVIVFAFFSNNLALFWILLELTTIISAMLIVVLSAKENISAALKYVFIASTAMLFSVIGLIILFAMTQQSTGEGTLNWAEIMQVASSLSPQYFTFAFVFIFIGFASKAGIAPFHTWLPQAHAKAPAMISAVLSGVLLNCGLYGILRLFAIAHQISSGKAISIIMIVFGALSIGIAALSMIPRSNLKKLIAFSSIEHMGLMLVGIALGTPVALFWVLFYMLAHSLAKTLLFFSAGILHHQYDSNLMPDMRNAFKLQPLATWGIILGSVAVIGLPPFPIFISKLFVLIQIGNFSVPLLVIVLILILIVAAAFAYLLIRAFCQQTVTKYIPYTYHWSMKASMVITLIAMIGTVVYLSFGFDSALNLIVADLGF